MTQERSSARPALRSPARGRRPLWFAFLIGAFDAAWGLYVFVVRPDGSGISLAVIGLVMAALAVFLMLRSSSR